VEAFAGAVVQLLEDAPLQEKLGQAAAHDVQERFAWDRLIEKIEQAYK
jgi:glycosyltransferase involved in cell wall biosynthesis